MDDLGLVVENTSALVRLVVLFNEYEAATGALLNYDKCFILTNQKEYVPEGRWAAMPKENYQGKRTKYLGIPVALGVDPMKDWDPTLRKFESVCWRIRRMSATTAERIRMINMYALSILEYVGRFRIMNNLVVKRVWRGMRKAMAGKWNILLRAFMSGKLLVNFSPHLRHPVLRNWALLASRAVVRETYWNPFSVGYARKLAGELIAQTLKVTWKELAELHLPASSLYKLLVTELPTVNLKEKVSDVWGDSRYRALIHNIQYIKEERERRVLLLLCFKGWCLKNVRTHWNKGTGDKCRLCGEKKETYHHILRECVTTLEFQ